VIGKSGKLCLGVTVLTLLASTTRAQLDSPAAASEPSTAEQQKLLAAMRRYAELYVSNLPNFLCTQVTQQFSAGKNTEHWHRGDTLTSRLVFNQGREERRLELVNDKPANGKARNSHTPLITEGEFGMLIDSILGPASAASLSWKGWDNVRGRPVAVFNYAINQEHSRLSLSLSDLASAVVPYHGSIYADPVDGTVWRVTNAITDIPPDVRTRSVSTTIEYGDTPIGSANYLLPVQASVTLFTGSTNLRNEIQFRNYRKFEADSNIIYRTGGN
jgi:hypothetical protein